MITSAKNPTHYSGKKAMDFITQTTPTVISHKPTGGGLKGGAPAAAANPASQAGYASQQLDLTHPVKEAPQCFSYFMVPAGDWGDGQSKTYEDTKKDFFMATWQTCMRKEMNQTYQDAVVGPFARLVKGGDCKPGADCLQWFLHGQTPMPRSVFPTNAQVICFLEFYVWTA